MGDCHGCQGRGWIDSQFVGPAACPLCKGTGSLPDVVRSGANAEEPQLSPNFARRSPFCSICGGPLSRPGERTAGGKQERAQHA